MLSIIAYRIKALRRSTRIVPIPKNKHAYLIVLMIALRLKVILIMLVARALMSLLTATKKVTWSVTSAK